MMCSLCKYQLRSKKWYLYIFYHNLTIALVNTWFLYRRDWKGLVTQEKPFSLKKFQAQVSTGLCDVGKPARGRPSLEGCKKTAAVHRTCDVAFVKCAKCKDHLCLNKHRNYFAEHHGY